MSDPQPGTSSGGPRREREEDEVPLTGEDSHTSSSDEPERPQKPEASGRRFREDPYSVLVSGRHLLESAQPAPSHDQAVSKLFNVIDDSIERASQGYSKLTTLMGPPTQSRLWTSLRSGGVLRSARQLLSSYLRSLADAVTQVSIARSELTTQMSTDVKKNELESMLDVYTSEKEREEKRQQSQQQQQVEQSEEPGGTQEQSQSSCSGYVNLPSTSKQPTEAEARAEEGQQLQIEIVSVDSGTESPIGTSPLSSDTPTALDTAGLSTISTALSADDQEGEAAASGQEKRREQEEEQVRVVEYEALLIKLTYFHQELEAVLRQHMDELIALGPVERLEQLDTLRRHLLEQGSKLRRVAHGLQDSFPHLSPPPQAAGAVQPLRQAGARAAWRRLLRLFFSMRRHANP